MHNSVLCIASLGLYNWFHPSRHTFNQLLTHLWLYSIPHLCHSLPNLPNSCCWCFILAQLQFDMMPEVFNGIKSGDCGAQSRRVILFTSIQFLAFLEVCLGSLSC